jgi:alpha-beta hydrolase superfamily lysophospholipase
VWKLLLAIILLYAAVCAFAFFFQDRALFPVEAARSGDPLPPGAERLALAAPDGTNLVGIHLPPRRPGPNPPLILGFGGNAWNADHAAEYLGDVFPGADIVTFHYRGYAPSGGRPGAAALLADSLLIHDFAAARFPGRPIVVIGFSIGSGVAAHLARERPVAGAVLVTPFDSLTSVAAGHAPWLPVRWRSSPAAPIRSSPRRAPTPSAAPPAPSSTTARSPAPGTMTSTPAPTSRSPCARRWRW